jgi:anti-sigma28 factor (negative regulator of flagellin synthesis)
MDADREQKVAEIKRKVRQGEYRVDPKLVADAIMRRLIESGLRPGARTRPVVHSGR